MATTRKPITAKNVQLAGAGHVVRPTRRPQISPPCFALVPSLSPPCYLFAPVVCG